MKLCAASPNKFATQDDVLAFLAEATATLVLLPGSSSSTPSPQMVQSAIRDGVSVFVEGVDRKMQTTPYLVTNRTAIAMPRQVFVNDPSAREIEELLARLPARTFALGSRTVTFYICGELIAFNPNGHFKHGRQAPKHDIIANPAHSIMGHWNYLGKKLSALSRKSVALYAANNNCKNITVTTDVRIYKSGKRLNCRSQNGKLAWCECDI